MGIFDNLHTPQNFLYSLSATGSEPHSVVKAELQRFITRAEQTGGRNIFCVSFPISGFFKTSFDLISKIRSVQASPLDVVMYSNDVFKLHNDTIFLVVNFHNNEYQLEVFSDQETCELFQKALGKNETEVKLTWWFTTEEGYFDERDLDFRFQHQSVDAFYPYITDGLKKYLAGYHDSESPILLLLGEPGTGKTSFIKHFIKEYNLNTVVTYDQKVMNSDFFYIQYLTDTKKQLLVIEDADVLLAPREEGENEVMSKLLNLSEGLVKLEAKKVIFTTNIQQISKIDAALLRPGRCYDVVNFRQLTLAEAQAACVAAGLDPVTEPKEYTLTEIFNRNIRTSKGRKFGF